MGPIFDIKIAVIRFFLDFTNYSIVFKYYNLNIINKNTKNGAFQAYG